MKESYGEGIASHTGPKSCVGVRKGEGEALTGVHAGPVLSREIVAPPRGGLLRGADALEKSGRPHLKRRHGKALQDPARSEARRMYGNTLCGNREIPRLCAVQQAAERIGESKDEADDERSWEVGQLHSTDEVAEQRRARGRGGDGGKGRGQGQCGPERHAPDTELGKRVTRSGSHT